MILAPNWLSCKLLCIIFRLARECGGEARVVGGAVRDLYLSAPPPSAPSSAQPYAQLPAPDIDVAISVPIADFSRAARAEGLAVYDTGIAHGTVTVRADNMQIEVTQLRTDHDQDGRHARVKLTNSWHEDATRRDFTMNALYLDEQGVLHDPVGGLADIKARQLRFIGAAQERLSEDYLRLLRGMRFRAQFPALWMADSDRMALREARAGLAFLSAERIAAELAKLFAGAGANEMIAEMQALSVDVALFDAAFILPDGDAMRLHCLWPYLNFTAQLALLFPKGQRHQIAQRLKLSRQDIQQAKRLDKNRPERMLSMLASDDWQQAAYQLSPDAVFTYAEGVLTDRLTLEPLRLRHIASFQLPRCPVKGGDVMSAFGLTGADISSKLEALEAMWVASNFKLTAEELLKVGRGV